MKLDNKIDCVNLTHIKTEIKFLLQPRFSFLKTSYEFLTMIIWELNHMSDEAFLCLFHVVKALHINERLLDYRRKFT
jgi:hypothetical protein